jgi:hypothetical protein
VLAPDQPPDRVVQEPPAVAAPDEVADGVADDRPGGGGDDGRGQADAVLKGEHAAKQDGDLTGEDEADER